jgi:signal transduction histidine kinase
MSELAKVKSPGSVTLLDSIGESAALMQENMRDLVWSVNPDNDSFGKVLQRMNQFASEILDGKGMDFQFIYDESISSEKLSMVQRKKIYMFFKEAINNAAKHSKATRVDAGIQLKNGILILTIADNGAGFAASEKNGGNGLANFKRRAHELGGQATIHSVINQGTKVQLSFKIT